MGGQPDDGGTVRPGTRLLDLVEVMDRLRRECPWDRKQTHRSLVTYLLEEAYETLEAIETGDQAHLREELGDLLLQVVFHARIASEAGAEGFDIDDVAGGIVDKLVHRHPHVFAGLEVADADEVDRNWEALKAAEKQRTSLLDGIPPALPALAYAAKVVGRLRRAGTLPAEAGASAGGSPGGSPGAAPEAAAGASPGATPGASPGAAPGGSLGERLLALVREAGAAGLDPEQELREAVRALVARSSAAAGDVIRVGRPGDQAV